MIVKKQSHLAQTFLAIAFLAQGSVALGADIICQTARNTIVNYVHPVIVAHGKQHWGKYVTTAVALCYITATNEKLSYAEIQAKKAKYIVPSVVTKPAEPVVSQPAAVTPASAVKDMTAVEVVKSGANAVKAELSAIAVEVKAEVRRDIPVAKSFVRQVKNFVKWHVCGNLEQAPRNAINKVTGEVLYRDENGVINTMQRGQPIMTPLVPARGLIGKDIVTDRLQKLKCIVSSCK